MKLPNRFSTVPVIGMLRRLFVLRLYAIAGQLLVILGVNYALHIALPLLPMLAIVVLSSCRACSIWAVMQRVGEVFFTTRQAQGGPGLGLFLANATLERLGGSVRMLPRDGGGARVAVSLPLQDKTEC